MSSDFARLQAADRVVEIRAAVQEVLGACDEHEREGEGAGRRRRCRDAFDGLLEVVDRFLVPAGRVFDRGADQTDFRCQANRLGCRFRRIAITVLEIRRDREIRGIHDRQGVGERIVASHRPVAIAAPERERETCARRGQSLESEAG
jgi:hypothetical protein